MWLYDLLDKERRLARTFGLRTPAGLDLSMPCSACGATLRLSERLEPRSRSGTDGVHRDVLVRILQGGKAACPGCGTRQSWSDGCRSAAFLFGERVGAFLVVLSVWEARDVRGGLRGFSNLRTTLRLAPMEGAMEDIGPSDPRLSALFLDDLTRSCVLASDPARAVKSLSRLLERHPGDPWIERELGIALADSGRHVDGLRHIEASLAARPSQPELLRRAGRLYVLLGATAEGSERLADAYDQTRDPSLLPPIVRATYQSERFGALRVAAHELRANDPENLLALKALLSCESAASIDPWRSLWRALRDAARAAGDRRIELTAEHWCSALDLPIPDWNDSLSHPRYAELLADTLRESGWDVRLPPRRLRWGSAELPIDVEAVTADGAGWAFFLIPSSPTPHVVHTLGIAFRALLADDERPGVLPVPLCSAPLPWSVQRDAARTAAARLDLEADADTTFAVPDENISSLAEAAQRWLGITLDGSVASLSSLDDLLAIYHDDGLGGASFALRCQIASYVGAVISSLRPGAEWADGKAPSDPRVLRLPDGTTVPVLSRIHRALRHGPQEGLAQWICAQFDAPVHSTIGSSTTWLQ